MSKIWTPNGTIAIAVMKFQIVLKSRNFKSQTASHATRSPIDLLTSRAQITAERNNCSNRC